MLNASLLDIPRPFIDPIDSLVEAVGIVSLAIERPIRHCTYALVLDAQRRGLGLLHAGPVSLITAHFLIGRISEIPAAESVMLVTTRTDTCVQPGDEELLQMLQHTFSHAGITLLDWVSVGRGGLY